MNKVIHLACLFLFSVILKTDVDLTFSVNSDSIWRGIDQNNGKSTLGSELEINLDNGFFSNVWIESCCSESLGHPNREVGFSSGYKIFLQNNISLSFAYIATNYPKSKIDNYDEVNFEIKIDNLKFKIFEGLDNHPNYYEVEYEFLSEDINVFLSVGDFKPFKNDASSNGINSKISMEFELAELDIVIFYYHFNSNGNSDLNDDGIVFSISKNLSF